MSRAFSAARDKAVLVQEIVTQLNAQPGAWRQTDQTLFNEKSILNQAVMNRARRGNMFEPCDRLRRRGQMPCRCQCRPHRRAGVNRRPDVECFGVMEDAQRLVQPADEADIRLDKMQPAGRQEGVELIEPAEALSTGDRNWRAGSELGVSL